jgi:hypothetical protein
MKKVIVLGLVSLLMTGLLMACTDNRAPSPTSIPLSPTATLVPATTAPPTLPPTPTTAIVALIPTATPTIVPPTRFPTATPRPGQSLPDIGPSLAAFRTTRISFLTAYNKAAARMTSVNKTATLVMAQSTIFTLDRTVWTFFFTPPQGTRSWSVIYDSGTGKDGKEQITVLDRADVLLPDEAGQLQPAKMLDSDEISTQLERGGLPPDLPIDTVFVQQTVVTKQGKIPAYIFVNGALNKQIIVNAQTGAVLQNDFS